MKIINEYPVEILLDEGDGVYVGYCRDLFIGGCCHGDTQEDVEKQLSKLIKLERKDYAEAGKELPEPSTRPARMTGALPARKATGLNQRRFSTFTGIPVATLRNWEQGRSKPTGPAQALLCVIEHDPDNVVQVLKQQHELVEA